MSSGLEAYGDPPDQGLKRTHPVTFLEDLLCLGIHYQRTACPEPTHFDILASDPYDIGPPTLHALSQLDATAPDLGRLMRVVRAAVRARTLLPAGPKPLWVTEFGYDSDPPNPTKGTISTATQARWLEESFYVFAREHVSTELWYLIRDQTPPYSENYFSGVYYRNGQPKPSYTAYLFPFVVMRVGKRARIWGISPADGTVDLQVPHGSSWATIATLRGRTGMVFSRLLGLPAGRYRTTVNGQDSLVWNYEPLRSPPRKRPPNPSSASQGPVISF